MDDEQAVEVESDHRDGAADPDPTAARLAQLEDSLRRLRSWVASLAVALAALAATGAWGLARGELTLRRLVVTGPDAAARIELTATAGEVALRHVDAEGNLRMSESVGSDGSASLLLLDAAGRKRLVSRADRDGSAALALLDGGEATRIQLATAAEGTSSILQADPARRKRIETYVTADGSAASTFLDASGVVRVMMGTSESGESTLAMRDAEGQPVGDN